jgi:hypothetical protein
LIKKVIQLVIEINFEWNFLVKDPEMVLNSMWNQLHQWSDYHEAFGKNKI